MDLYWAKELEDILRELDMLFIKDYRITKFGRKYHYYLPLTNFLLELDEITEYSSRIHRNYRSFRLQQEKIRSQVRSALDLGYSFIRLYSKDITADKVKYHLECAFHQKGLYVSHPEHYRFLACEVTLVYNINGVRYYYKNNLITY